MSSPKIEIYTTPTCSSCVRAKRYFTSRDLAVTEIDVSMDRSEMIQRADGRSSVPQIFVKNVGIGGWDALMEMVNNDSINELTG